MTGEESAQSLLIQGFEELPLAATTHQLERLLTLTQLLDEWSKRVNLTGHRTAPEIVRRLILDAAALAAQLPEIDSLADIGSGAGFPGLPIAIPGSSPEVRLI